MCSSMVNSTGVGFMAIVAVSGSVMFVALQAHRRLVSEFMKKVELELGGDKDRHKKKVRFADDVLEPSTNNKEYRLRHSKVVNGKTQLELEDSNRVPALTQLKLDNSDGIPAKTEVDDGNTAVGERDVPIPLNRLALYNGIKNHRMLNRRF